jgi:hypothetical protein
LGRGNPLCVATLTKVSLAWTYFKGLRQCKGECRDMTDPTYFNPYSIESHYGLEMACFLVHRIQPRSVRICTSDPEVAKAAVRRLAWVESLVVEQEQIAEAIAAALGIHPSLIGEVEPDAALVPFSRQQYTEPPRAQYMVVLGHNGLSYKSFLYPGRVRDNVIAQLLWLRPKYLLDQQIGLFGPSFLTRWTLSMVAGPRLPSLHFQLGQRALDRLYTTGAFWWTGYITILAGRWRA